MTEPIAPTLEPEWLRAGLTAAGLDPEFTALDMEYLGRFSHDVWRVDLDNGVRLLAKRPCSAARPGDPPDVEQQFYRWVAEHRELPVPRFIGSIGGVLVIEFIDLEPFDFVSGADPEHVRLAVAALAAWHARWWQRPPEAGWLQSYGDVAMREAIQRRYDAAWSRHRQALLAHAPEFEMLGDALVGRLAQTLAPMATPATLIHGDAHAENVRRSEAGALLLDWQEPAIANPGLDLAVFTTMSFPEAARASREQEVVARHVTAVRALDCHWPDPWRDYRLGLLRRVARIVEIADAGFASLPWVFRRSAVAAVDHEVGELVR